MGKASTEVVGAVVCIAACSVGAHAGSFAFSHSVFPLKAGFLIFSFIEETVFLERK